MPAARERIANLQGRPVPDPTIEEIAEAAAAIRRTWDHATEMARLGHRVEDTPAAKPHGYSPAPPRGIASTRPPSRREW
jgi:hypothetical protein